MRFRLGNFCFGQSKISRGCPEYFLRGHAVNKTLLGPGSIYSWDGYTRFKILRNPGYSIRVTSTTRLLKFFGILQKFHNKFREPEHPPCYFSTYPSSFFSTNHALFFYVSTRAVRHQSHALFLRFYRAFFPPSHALFLHIHARYSSPTARTFYSNFTSP